MPTCAGDRRAAGAMRGGAVGGDFACTTCKGKKKRHHMMWMVSIQARRGQLFGRNLEDRLSCDPVQGSG